VIDTSEPLNAATTVRVCSARLLSIDNQEAQSAGTRRSTAIMHTKQSIDAGVAASL